MRWQLVVIRVLYDCSQRMIQLVKLVRRLVHVGVFNRVLRNIREFKSTDWLDVFNGEQALSSIENASQPALRRVALVDQLDDVILSEAQKRAVLVRDVISHGLDVSRLLFDIKSQLGQLSLVELSKNSFKLTLSSSEQ